jgi:hypothetical protein
MDTKKFLDQTGTGYLWQKIQSKLSNKADTATVSAIDERVTVAEGKIDALEKGTYDDTAVRALIQDNTNAITKLNAGSTTEGSVAYQIAEIVNENNNGSIDTLNEIAAWIVSDTTGAAKMSRDITANGTAIEALQDLVGSTSVAAQITAALQTDGVDKYALASELTALAARVKAIEDLGITAEKISNWDTVAAGSYDSAGSAEAVYNNIIALSSAEIDAVTDQTATN